MEKLLQLLNEYRLEKGASEYTKYISETWYFTHKLYFYEHYSWVICKKFWFIQWLVDNNKTKEVEYWLWYTSYSESDNLIRLLSVQDDPISFLASILK